MPGKTTTSEQWSAETKLAVIVETATMSELALKQAKADQRKIKELEKDLRRKNAALAETPGFDKCSNLNWFKTVNLAF